MNKLHPCKGLYVNGHMHLVFSDFPLTCYVVKKNEKSASIELGLSSALVVVTEFIVFCEGEVVKHPKTGEVLDVEKIHIGRLCIIKCLL